MDKRILGRSGIEVSPLGLGCWAIGGPFWRGDGTVPWQDRNEPLNPAGLGPVDDQESIRAIQTAIDMGVMVFDTSSSYGCGHSERVLGQAIAGQRDKVVIATKFGNLIDEENKVYLGHDASPEQIRASCIASLQRLGTDYIDVFQLHWSSFDGDITDIMTTLEDLVQEGKIRGYGWSTDDVERMATLAEGQHCTAVQHFLSVLNDATEMLAFCDAQNLASINRSPLNMGQLTGKYHSETSFPEDDIRHGWDFKNEHFQKRFQVLDDLRDALTCDGRSMVQGALAWIWARSERTIPIPGFKSVQQVEENARALDFGPLTTAQFQQVEEIMARV